MQDKKIQDSVIVYLNYGKGIKRLIHKTNDIFAFTEQADADVLLGRFFETYPIIFEKAIPGTLTHRINGAFAYPQQLLRTGDMVELELITLRSLRIALEKEMDNLIKEFKLQFTTEQIKKAIFEEKTEIYENFLNKFAVLPKKYNNEDLLVVEDVLIRAWNTFPQKKLKGKSQMETLHNELLKEFKRLHNNITQVKFEKS